MDIVAAIVLLAVFVVLLFIGVPVAFCIGLSTMAAMLLSVETLPTMTTVAQRLTTGLDSFALLAIPFFILAGQLMNRGGIAKRLVGFARAIIGSLPGGLAHVNVVAAMLFGAVSGSAAAAATAVGGFMGPEMKKDGYDPGFSAAVNITSATTGLLIPPSNILIIYSLAAGGLSIGALFVAGYVPGIIVGLALMVVAGFHAHRKGYATGKRTGIRELVNTFLRAVPSLFLLVVVIGGIVAGVFTATEAAAVAVAYALGLAFLYREMGARDLPGVLLDTVRTTAIVMLLIGTSVAMSWVLSYEHIPQQISDTLIALTDNPVVVLLIINGILLLVGTFMDMTPAVLIFTPIFLPVVVEMGVDPIHFGIMMVLNLCVGLCTPPVGSILFIGAAVADISMTKLVRPLLPLFLAMVAALLLVTYIPALSLWLPGLFGL